jgi:Tol biopolymer transport system component
MASATIILMFILAMACSPRPPQTPLQPCYFAVRVETKDDAMVILMDQTGEAIVTLPTGSTSPSFSPDRSLYYAAPVLFDDWEFFQIFRLDLDTRETIRLSDGTSNNDSPACSWGGDQIAFISHQIPVTKIEDGYWRIALMDSEGNNRRFLDQTGEIQQLSPIWSPDGKKIVYVRRSTIQEMEKENCIRSTLKIHDLDTHTSQDLLPVDYLVAYPSWSPQGDLIAFTVLEQENKSSLWVVRADGTGTRRLTSDHNDTQASWMPDGRSLLFSREEGKRRVICEVNLESLQVTPFFERQLSKLLGDKAGEAILEFPRIYFLPKPEAGENGQEKPKK